MLQDRPAPPNLPDAPEPPDVIEDPPADLGVPMIEVVGPVDGSAVPADSVIDIVARITDAQGVASATLEWRFNGISYECPRQGDNVSCAVVGDEYRWTVLVGAVAERPFRVRARNSRRRVTTTDERAFRVHPAGDPEGPNIVVLAPTPDTVWRARTVVRVQARIRDDDRVAEAGLDWEFTDEVFACPLRSQYVDCDVDGDLYTWDLTVGEGARPFTVVATDPAGNEARSRRRIVDLL